MAVWLHFYSQVSWFHKSIICTGCILPYSNQRPLELFFVCSTRGIEREPFTCEVVFYYWMHWRYFGPIIIDAHSIGSVCQSWAIVDRRRHRPTQIRWYVSQVLIYYVEVSLYLEVGLCSVSTRVVFRGSVEIAEAFFTLKCIQNRIKGSLSLSTPAATFNGASTLSTSMIA